MADDSARESRALIDLARTTTINIYALLELEPDNTTAATLKKAWRVAALKHHPDKNRGNEEAAADKLAEVRQALDILNDDAARSIYDDKRRAQREKQERDSAFEGKRRKMKEDLERRESASWSPAGMAGMKRKAAETPEAKREEKIRTLAEQGARRRQEVAERRRREMDGITKADDDDPFVDAKKPATSASFTPNKAFSKSTSSNGTSSPSFSFSSRGTPGKDAAPSGARKGSALFEATMQRLREAEKKRLEEQIRRDEASLDSAKTAT
jgi:curved DNA-binding protein CbpA